MTGARLLEIRNAIKARKPNFKIQNSNDPKKRFAGRWKRPKGLQSKMRERRKGNPKYIEPGYGSPAAVRGASHEGLFPVVVSNVNDLANVHQGMGVIIAASVGLRKKSQIAAAAVGKKLKLLNADAAELAKRVGSVMSERKERRKAILAKRHKVVATKEAKKAEKEKPADIESAIDEDEKKKAEKAEKDKVLTKAK